MNDTYQLIKAREVLTEMDKLVADLRARIDAMECFIINLLRITV